MPERIGPVETFLLCFAISALGGFAALLKSRRPLTGRNIATAVLYSGSVGLVIGLIWFNYFNTVNNVFMLIGSSGLAGLSGTTAADIAVRVLGQGGLTFLTPKKKDQDNESE